jgi:hypothetical protein
MKLYSYLSILNFTEQSRESLLVKGFNAWVITFMYTYILRNKQVDYLMVWEYQGKWNIGECARYPEHRNLVLILLKKDKV